MPDYKKPMTCIWPKAGCRNMELPVYQATSFSALWSAVSGHERQTLKSAGLSAFLKTWVFAVNCGLRSLQRYLFPFSAPHASRVKEIIIYTVGIVGDNVSVLPGIASVRRAFPAAVITLISNHQVWSSNGAKAVFEKSQLIDRLITIDDQPVTRNGHRFLITNEALKGLRGDLFVNLSPFGNRGWLGAVLKEMIFAKMGGARWAVGFRMSTYARKGLFNRVQYRFVLNEPRRSGDVISELGFEPAENEDLLPRDFDARKAVFDRIDSLGLRNKPFFVLNPGAKFRPKCWPAERFGQVARWLQRTYGAASIVTGTGEEKSLAEDVVAHSDGAGFSVAGDTSILELIELLRMARGCVTNDTGTMHIAAMTGIPTVGIFSTRHSPTHWFPQGKRVVALFTLPPCRYCYNDACQDPICLMGINVEDVQEGLKKVMPE